MWQRLPTQNVPSARCAHQADRIGNKLYVFGGWSETQMLNDLQVLDCDTLSWSSGYDSQVDLSFVACRSGHSMNAVGTNLIVFGGGAMIDSSNVFLNETLLFDTGSKRWSMIDAGGNIPGGRTKHSSNLIDSKLYIVGGGDGLRLYDDVYSLDTETMTWYKPQIKGVPPSPRWGHSTVQAGSQLVVFGGHEGIGRVNDVHILDTVSMTWRREACVGRSETEVPRPRAGHVANLIGYHMLVWGGGDGHVLPNMYGLDTRTWKWWFAGGTPARCAQTSTVVGNKLLCFGGGDGVACFNDSYYLDIEDKLETLFQAKPQAFAPVPLPRQSHTEPQQSASTNRAVAHQNTKKNIPLEKVQSSEDTSQPPLQRPPGSPPTRRRSNSKTKKEAAKLASLNLQPNSSNLIPSPRNHQESTHPTSPLAFDNNTIPKQIVKVPSIPQQLTKDLQGGIAAWLNSLGMNKYLSRFVAEEIDMDIIDMVTETHLKLLGIPLGDRLRICAAICNLPKNGTTLVKA